MEVSFFYFHLPIANTSILTVVFAAFTFESATHLHCVFVDITPRAGIAKPFPMYGWNCTFGTAVNKPVGKLTLPS